MTVSVEELVKQLGERYQDIKDKGLLPYKLEPYARKYDNDAYMDLKQFEGVFLSFDNDKDKRFNEISLHLEDKEKTDWIFPNEMPFNLELVMTQKWIRERFGIPMVYGKPKTQGVYIRGDLEIYPLPFHDLAVQFVYDFNKFVVQIVFYSLEHAKDIQEKVEKLRLEGIDY